MKSCWIYSGGLALSDQCPYEKTEEDTMQRWGRDCSQAATSQTTPGTPGSMSLQGKTVP